MQSLKILSNAPASRLLLSLACVASISAPSYTTATMSSSSSSPSIYSLTATKNDDSIFSMESTRNKVIYATNVASKWGRTGSSYAEFEALSEKYGPDQLVILAFPSRQFGYQEYKEDEKIREFAAGKNFPKNGVGVLMKLGSVKGKTAPDVWKALRDEVGDGNPTWNFSAKYLVDKNGQVSIPKGNVVKAIDALMEDGDEL